jgi:hypothetical protein
MDDEAFLLRQRMRPQEKTSNFAQGLGTGVGSLRNI